MTRQDPLLIYCWRTAPHHRLARNHELSIITPVSSTLFYAIENIELWTALSMGTSTTPLMPLHCPVLMDKVTTNIKKISRAILQILRANASVYILDSKMDLQLKRLLLRLVETSHLWVGSVDGEFCYGYLLPEGSYIFFLTNSCLFNLDRPCINKAAEETPFSLSIFTLTFTIVRSTELDPLLTLHLPFFCASLFSIPFQFVQYCTLDQLFPCPFQFAYALICFFLSSLQIIKFQRSNCIGSSVLIAKSKKHTHTLLQE